MKEWYIVQLISGNEEKIKSEIEKRALNVGLADKIGEILTPTVKVSSSFYGLSEDKDEKEQLFPGYMVVNIDPSLEMFSLIKSIPGIIRFLGGDPPVPLSQNEVEKIKSQVSGEITVSKVERSFEIGREVDIASGPFSGFIGQIKQIDEIKKKMTVTVSIFGRLTPVEISFDQVRS